VNNGRDMMSEKYSISMDMFVKYSPMINVKLSPNPIGPK